jgi:hypothetical protein
MVMEQVAKAFHRSLFFSFFWSLAPLAHSVSTTLNCYQHVGASQGRFVKTLFAVRKEAGTTQATNAYARSR